VRCLGDRALRGAPRRTRSWCGSPEATEEQRVKSVSRETEVIVWPPVRPGRVLTEVFEDL
jgi:hypothetical protein